MRMYIRFPELAPPETLHDPTPNAIASGEWCFPNFRPDESSVTMLDPDLPVATQFASIAPEYLWLENDDQAVVAVKGTHLHEPDNRFYDDLRSLYDHFVAETNGKNRKTLREGHIWPPSQIATNDAEIIATGGDALYLQSLASRNGVECISAEPEDDRDIFAIMRHYPRLEHAARMYIKMRILPQAYKKQQHDPSYNVWRDGTVVFDYFRRYVDARLRHHGNGRSWMGNHLYSINHFSGPGCLNSMGLHLSRAHELYDDQGRTLKGRQLIEGPREEIVDQIFRCTNSPVFHAGDIAYEDLCEVQQVAVLANRLRDRRIAYLLADLGRSAVSYFWMSGPLHYEALLPGLRGMANERDLSGSDMQAKLGLLATRTSTVTV